ncbi:MAG: diadenosine tetraphosphate (Ap4A) HIT family hydrolase [Glaciecola sp.]|jgi:diadenosine tetraphosphate (Ap4A) HIT family hydrolase
MPTLIHQRVKECQQGTYLKLICRVSSGWVVMGDVQFLKGYCLLLPDPVVANLNELNEQGRKAFLWEMSVVGDVILEVTGALRINYEMIGNVEPALHAHIFPRYENEPDNLKLKPVWFYDWEAARAFDKSKDNELMQSIAAGLKAKGL